MNWSSGNLRTFVPRSETSFDVLYNYGQFPGMEQMKHMYVSSSIGLLPGESIMEKNIQYGYSGSSSQERKKRLTNDQLELLEMSFQEEIKLDPDRKKKLSRELGLEPRQISVWFQNRRARWKSKQLELLYDSLKQEYDAVSREKLMLQEEVMKLKCMLREQAIRNNKQVSTGITQVSGEETVESKSMANNKHQIAEGNYLFNVDEYDPSVSSPFSPLLPTNYYQ